MCDARSNMTNAQVILENKGFIVTGSNGWIKLFTTH